MIIGIDVGGTHTDAVIVHNGNVLSKVKVPTDSDSLITSLLSATEKILADVETTSLKRIVFSTTLCTNAIIQNKTEHVGIIAIPGPGVAPFQLPMQEHTEFVPGYVNHRGEEMVPLSEQKVKEAALKFKEQGIELLGVVGKFSTRNPSQELRVHDLLKGEFHHISLGHNLSGQLNFPRRICTTYLNSAIFRIHNNLVKEVLSLIRKKGINVPTYILKADGGTIDIHKSTNYPVQTILSGPAASIMGILGLNRIHTDAISIDIGGTTTDISFFANGVPLLEPFGVTINGYKTLIRGLRTHSIGLGGDSVIRIENNTLQIGPERKGPAAALGGYHPTPTDAMVVLGYTSIGNIEKSVQALQPLALKLKKDIHALARDIVETFCNKIASEIKAFLEEINEQPVYTVHEIVRPKKIKPEVAYLVGGPASCLAPHLSKTVGLKVQIPKNAEVANAIGAALARTTAEMILVADTEKEQMIISETDEKIQIPRNFTKEEVIQFGKKRLREKALSLGSTDDDVEMEIVEDLEFNMVRNMYLTGKNIRVKLQIKPGILSHLH
ncbi:MAG: hydantoinase/oxoprolinase family protein [Syntrophales bacterium]|nr:hydantoinase/oxoprolinase family protein [Syntrophales bacterium]